jgi:hypothetical protein
MPKPDSSATTPMGGAGREAQALMSKLKQINYPALYVKEDKWYSYKLISLYAAIAEITLPGDFAEFGVYRGRCARFLAHYLFGNRQLHLFDSFEGLPEDWIGQFKKGAFSLPLEDIPRFGREDVHVHVGWFVDTIPRVKARLRAPLALIHADADLYKSTMDVLEGLDDLIAPGTIILFDEYAMENGGEYDDGEHRALIEWATRHERQFDYLWRTQHCQVAVRITK